MFGSISALIALVVAGVLVAAYLVWCAMTLRTRELAPLPAVGGPYLALFGFGLALGATIASLALREDPYTRPWTFFLGLSVAAGFATWQALSASQSAWRIVAYAEAIAIGIAFVVSQDLMFPTLLETDPWGHQLLTEAIARTKHVPASLAPEPVIWPISDAVPYLTIPGMHLALAQIMLVTGLQYKAAALLVVGVFSLIVVGLSAAVIAERVVGRTYGPLAALVAIIADNVLNLSSKAIIPNTLGFALCFVAVLVTIHPKRTQDLRWSIVWMILCAALLFTHSFSYLFLILMTLTWAAALHFARTGGSAARPYWISALTAGFAWLAYFAFVSESNFARFVRTVSAVFSEGVSQSNYTERVTASLGQIIAARAGMIFLFLLAAGGAFWFLLRRRQHKELWIVGLFGIGAALSFAAIYTPNLQGLAFRFWFFTEVIAAVLATIAAGLLLASSKRAGPSALAICLTVSIMAGVMMTSAIAANDRPLVPQYSVRTGLTDEEMAGLEFAVAARGDKLLVSDFYYGSRSVYLGVESFEVTYLDDYRPAESNEIHLFRGESIVGRFTLFGSRYDQHGVTVSHDDVAAAVAELDRSSARVYDSGEVQIFYGLG